MLGWWIWAEMKIKINKSYANRHCLLCEQVLTTPPYQHRRSRIPHLILSNPINLLRELSAASYVGL